MNAELKMSRDDFDENKGHNHFGKYSAMNFIFTGNFSTQYCAPYYLVRCLTSNLVK